MSGLGHLGDAKGALVNDYRASSCFESGGDDQIRSIIRAAVEIELVRSLLTASR